MIEIKDYWDVYGNPVEAYKYIRELEKQLVAKDAQLKIARKALKSIQLFIHDGVDMKQIATEALKQMDEALEL